MIVLSLQRERKQLIQVRGRAGMRTRSLDSQPPLHSLGEVQALRTQVSWSFRLSRAVPSHAGGWIYGWERQPRWHLVSSDSEQSLVLEQCWVSPRNTRLPQPRGLSGEL